MGKAKYQVYVQYLVFGFWLFRVVFWLVITDIMCDATRQDGVVAQLGERSVRNAKVGGSIPPGSTKPELIERMCTIAAEKGTRPLPWSLCCKNGRDAGVVERA